MAVASDSKVIPVPDAVSRPYWDGTRNGELRLQRCSACESFQFYPRPMCLKCGSRQLEWRTSSGRGTLYSFTIVWRAPSAAYAADIPYVVALVDLPEGVRMLTNIVGISPESAYIGMPVVPVFERLTEDIVLPKFAPAMGGKESDNDAADLH